ncbi:tetratricopeptide repeat protein [Pseudothermotoga sp.]|nr:tetratricopeptide repeat protein [Pseudothermotoga sp.]MCX7812607.1 tetratricopeptide repeat protein [Pseudothermotoga sp.]MDW8138886.1 tetratricopeptide repeat protein [Pseudothermotoga sp.]
MSDAVERLIRELIRENQLSKARGILSIFQDDYPHLMLELEAASGNWMAVLKLYERLSEEKKEEYKTLYKTAQERVKENYKEDIKDSFEEMDRANLEGAMAILESVSKTYPELVEVIALKLELARRKGDKAREKIFEDLLKKLDASHPTLLKKSEGVRKLSFDMIMLVLISATLIFSILGVLFSGPRKAELSKIFEEKLAPISEQTKNLNEMSKRLSMQIGSVESKLQEMTQTDVKLAQDLSVLKSQINGVLSEIESSRQVVLDAVDQIKQLLITTSSVRKTYTLQSEFDTDTARSIWLFGYSLYKKGYYLDAAELLKSLLSHLKNDLYFKDDAHYYMALSYYYAGNNEEAKRAFDSFLKAYPTSQYAGYAKSFLSRIGQ